MVEDLAKSDDRVVWGQRVEVDLMARSPVLVWRNATRIRLINAFRTVYQAPLYKILTRAGVLLTTGHSTNYVMNMEVSSKQPQDYWIRAGVAMFLALR